jgi:hypothetical protein
MAASAEARGGPALSVVVVPFAGERALARCLAALARQRGASPDEVLVPADDEFPGAEDAARAHPRARVIRERGRRGPAALRAAGLRAARGRIVAFTEDHCVPADDWCASLLAAHAAPHAAIGGAVEKDEGGGTLGWALYLCDYGRYMRPLAEGPAEYLTDVNVSYKRAAIASLPEAVGGEFIETAVHWALARRGETLWLSPRIVVRQRRDARLAAALRDRFAHGRAFAGTRVAAMPAPRRVVRAAASAVLPLVLVRRAVGQAVSRRRHVAAAARALPAMLVLTAAWALGECVGYLAGAPPRPAEPTA